MAEESYLHHCVLYRDLSSLVLLLDHGSDINVRDKQGRTPLHVAVKEEYIAGIEVLLKRGAEVNLKDEDGNTSLHQSVSNVEIIQALLDKGASLESTNSLEETPLLSALRVGIELVVRLLLSKGASIKVKNMYGESPLHIAVLNCSHTVFKLLFDKGSDVDAKCADGSTPLHIAAQLGKFDIMKMLLKQGADPNKTCGKPLDGSLGKGCTALHYAAQNESMLQLLLESGANPNISNACGNTPLFYSIGNHESVKLLLNAGADVSFKNDIGDSPLHEAVKIEDYKTVKILLKRGANIDMRNAEGNTPLHFAVMNDDKLIVELLIEWGASLSITNNLGYTPELLGRHNNNIVPVFQRFLVKLKTVKLFQNKISYIKDTDSFQISCLEELKRMKETKHGNHSVFDVLCKYHDPYFVTNAKLQQEILNSKIQFPIYQFLLFGTFLRAKERYKLLNDAQDNFNISLLPKEIKRNILTFLSDEDLENVLKAFKKLI